MVFLEAILPIFALTGAGVLLGWKRGIDPAPLTDASLYILLPILLFTSLVLHPVTRQDAVQVFGFVVATVLSYWLLVALIGKLLGWDGPTRSAVTLSLSSVNAASYGLPVALFAFGDEALALATLLTVGFNVYNSSLGVYIAACGRMRPRDAFVSVFRLPMIYGVVLAVLVILLEIELPEKALDFLLLAGKAAPQLGLIVLGVQVSRLKLAHTRSVRMMGTTLTKLLVSPAFGFLLVFLLGAEGTVRNCLLLFACLPTAINGLLLSIRMDSRPDLVSGVIFATTLLSPIPIVIVLTYLS